MLKGHVQIDIHNHNSGFTERYEQDNMVTKALDYIIPNWQGANRVANEGIMPLATGALGGLMLFDGELTESEDNIFFPNEAHLIACAGQGTNGDNPRMGSKNASESKELATGYQSVWDFNTSQANGSIRSLALTLNQFSGDTGCRPFEGYWWNYTLHNVRRLDGDRASTLYPLHYDVDTQTMYFIGGDGYSYSSVYDSNRRVYTYTYNMTVYQEYLPMNKWKVSDAADRADYPEAVTQISFDIESTTRGADSDPRPWIRNGYDGYAYIVWVNQNTSGNGSFVYRKVKLSDLSFELSDAVTVQVTSCSLAGGMNSGIINNGKCLLRGYNGRWLYVVDLANPVNVRSVDLGEGFWALNYEFSNFRNGVVKFQAVSNSSSASRYYFYDALLYTDGWVVMNAPWVENTSYPIVNAHSRLSLITDNLMVYGRGYGSYYSYGNLVNNYLGTICNLSSPVVKNAASSMKVIYTLTDVDE